MSEVHGIDVGDKTESQAAVTKDRDDHDAGPRNVPKTNERRRSGPAEPHYLPRAGRLILPRRKLRLDGGTQARVALDKVTIEDYAAAMLRGDQFPPVKVVYDGTDYWLWDGFHTYWAQEKLGLDEVECDLRYGTIIQARWLSLAANKSHGLRRTNQDKQRAVETALRARPDYGDRQIGHHVGVDHKTVAAARERLSGEIPQTSTRTGRDGRITKAKRQRQPAKKGRATSTGSGIVATTGTTATDAVQPDGELTIDAIEKKLEEGSESLKAIVLYLNDEAVQRLMPALAGPRRETILDAYETLMASLRRRLDPGSASAPDIAQATVDTEVPDGRVD